MEHLIQAIGKAVKAVAKSRSFEWWYTPHMVVASGAIDQCIPLVDLVLKVRDARLGFDTVLHDRNMFVEMPEDSDVIRMSTIERQEWLRFLEEQNCMAFGVNAHNKENIKEKASQVMSRTARLNEAFSVVKRVPVSMRQA